MLKFLTVLAGLSVFCTMAIYANMTVENNLMEAFESGKTLSCQNKMVSKSDFVFDKNTDSFYKMGEEDKIFDKKTKIQSCSEM